MKQVSEKLTELAHTVGLKSYWNIHAYSQLVLYPWSWTTKRAKDYYEIVSRTIVLWMDKLFQTFYPFLVL